ncbi:Uncharacterised protein [Mycobacteroides abscessus subsp. abscessus]|nr:Uncharacterised protein [Mycobacteroides abscessus subsp. abscessus]
MNSSWNSELSPELLLANASRIAASACASPHAVAVRWVSRNSVAAAWPASVSVADRSPHSTVGPLVKRAAIALAALVKTSRPTVFRDTSPSTSSAIVITSGATDLSRTPSTAAPTARW